ncbi:peptidoglycan DD-metalloendopeptidase family protein [Rhodoferax sp. PAMC 29310]|uniref:peptidoglycan DD-metalloendopeptidase family protein n=1 Tax=Rhodoferax sp. PAMC 29310 TaxID=2822760 RepID=UPI001B3232BF|nr:peptidoglycan DD-metalloendopeptidase family protein [Rhodoferax sp. PAMC 29310]
MFAMSGRVSSVLALLVVGGLLVGCSSTPLNRAPVVDRGATTAGSIPVLMDPNTPLVKQPPGFENAGKPGYYTVKPGDTMTRIGLETGQTAKDIARWSGVENPHKIEVGQVLRVVPPVASSTPPVAMAPVTTATGVVTQPVTQATVTPTGNASPPSSTTVSPVQASGGDDEIAWIWPTSGSVLAGFDEVKNKGLDIGGSVGDAIVAAADGRVVYVGAGLRGYGNLIILKHNNTYLTAYAHNKSLLVIEDQAVRKGQKIAEMGNSDADRVKLHFEVRRQGKPVDPAKYLPAR